jgi:hypothetical protein
LKIQSIFVEVLKFDVEENPIAQKTILHKNAGHGGVWAVATGAQIFFRDSIDWKLLTTFESTSGAKIRKIGDFDYLALYESVYSLSFAL